MSDWVEKLVYEVLSSYSEKFNSSGERELAKMLLNSDVVSIKKLSGFYDVSLNVKSDKLKDTDNRLIFDDVVGKGENDGTRISTLLFVLEGKVDSLELIAEKYEWSENDKKFELFVEAIPTI